MAHLHGAFRSPDDGNNPALAVRPVVFDILGPDFQTSLLPDGIKMVLHTNPSSMTFNYQKLVSRIQTFGGWVEQHWGDGARTISFEMVTGGFKRAGSGLTHSTGGPFGSLGRGTRRDTIAYDRYENMLALFENNGSVTDSTGQIIFQGAVQMTYDGDIYQGVFNSFTRQEDSSRPFMFNLSAEFTIQREILQSHSMQSTLRSNLQPLIQR